MKALGSIVERLYAVCRLQVLQQYFASFCIVLIS